MARSYQLGLFIVIGSVLVAAMLAPLVPSQPTRAAMNLAGSLPPLGPFQLTERSGKSVTDRDLAGKTWIAGFIFTRCRASCPRITADMKGLHDALSKTGVKLVSISVDPDHDTPAVLSRYASRFEADPDRWWFLTGDKAEVARLVRERFKLSLAPMDPNDPVASMMDIAHSERLALVDPSNQVVGLFNPEDKSERQQLLAQARRLDRAWVGRLPSINAGLNGLSTLLLLLGLPLVLSRRVRGHQAVMLSALAVSGLFLSCYLFYHGMIGGGTPYPGHGFARLLYFTVLISHVVLAMVMVPLIVITIARVVQKQFERHAALARVTYPIWLYVSITGVVVYVMLYRMPEHRQDLDPPAASASGAGATAHGQSASGTTPGEQAARALSTGSRSESLGTGRSG